MESNSKPPRKFSLSDIELVVISTKELEARLVKELFATKFKTDKTATSFYDKQKEVEHLFSTEDREKFKYISSVRNILVHNVEENRINDRRKFENTITDLNSAIDVAKTKLKTTSKPKGCFIATAVYGDYDHYQVKILRDYRDTKLLRTVFGRMIVKLYYIISPPIADILQKNKTLAKSTRKVLDKIIEKIKQ